MKSSLQRVLTAVAVLEALAIAVLALVLLFGGPTAPALAPDTGGKTVGNEERVEPAAAAVDTAPTAPGQGEPAPSAASTGARAEGILLYGRMVGPEDQAIPGARIQLQRLLPVPALERFVSASPGRYATSGLAPGTWRLWARADGFRDVMQELELSTDAPHLRWDVILEPALVVKVKIVDEAGRPLHQVLGELAVERPGLREVQVTALATRVPPPGDFPPTASRDHSRLGIGRWTYGQGASANNAMAPEYAGTLEIEADPPVWASAVIRHRVLASAPIAAGQEEVTLAVSLAEVLGSLTTVRLRAVDGATGQPLAGARVELSDVGTGWAFRAVDADGILQCSDLRPGWLVFSVAATGYAGLRGTLMLRPGEELDLGDVPLSAPVAVAGVTVDGAGNPAACDLRAIPLDPLPGGARFQPRTTTRATDAEGTIALELAPGRYLLFASGPRGLSEEIDCSRGPVTGLRLPLKRTVTLHLSAVFDKDEAFEVRIQDERGRRVWSATFYSHYEVDVPLLPGSYQVQIATPGGAVLRAQKVRLGKTAVRVEVGG